MHPITYTFDHSIKMLGQFTTTEVNKHLNKDKTGQLAETLFTGLSTKKTWSTNKNLCLKALSLHPKKNPKFTEQRSQFVRVLAQAGLFKKSNQELIKNILQTACQQNDKELLNDMLNQGVLDSIPTEVLPLVCAHGNFDMVEMVLKSIANTSPSWSERTLAAFRSKTKPINRENSNGKTPLTAACERGHTRMVELLLKHGADTTPRPNSSTSPALEMAYQNGHLRIVKMLLKKMPNSSIDYILNKSIDNVGNIQIDIIKACLSVINDKTRIESQDPGNRMLPFTDTFFKVMSTKNQEAIRAFLNAGMVLSNTALSVAIVHAADDNNLRLVQKLIQMISVHESPELEDAFICAAANNNLLMLQALFEHQPDSAIPSSILSFAANHGNKEMVEWTFDHVPQIDDEAKKDALFFAVRRNNLALTQLLLERGGFPAITENHLLTACQRNNLELVELLLVHGFNMDIYDQGWYIAAACEKNNLSIVKLLINHQIKIDWEEVYVIINTHINAEIFDFFNELAVQGEENPRIKACLIACKMGDLAVFQDTLTQEVITSPQVTKIGVYVAQNGNAQLMETLYERVLAEHQEFTLDSKMAHLAIAGSRNNLELVKWLVHPDHAIPSDRLQTGLALAFTDFKVANVSICLLKAGIVPEPKILQLYLQNESVFNLLGANNLLHLCDTEGNTLLHLASIQKNDEKVVRLIEAGLDPEIALANGYTPDALAFLGMCHRSSVNQEQLSNVGMAAVVIPEAPPEANRQDLFTLATRLEKTDGKDYTSGITKMAAHIDGNTAYLGVPGDETKRTAWYAVLNSLLKLIAVELPNHSEEVQKDVFVQLNYTSPDCGGAWMDESKKQYLRLTGQADILVKLEDPTVKVHTLLAEFKQRALAQLHLDYVTQHNLDARHTSLFLDKELGTLLGIAGKETEIEDVYAPERLKRRPLLEELFKFYNPIEMTKWFAEEVPQHLPVRKVGESFGPYIQQWVESNMGQVAKLLNKEPGEFEKEYDDRDSWVAETCFNSLQDKVNPGSLSLMGTFLLLNAAGALAPK